MKRSTEWLAKGDWYFNDNTLTSVVGTPTYPIPLTRAELTGWNPRTAFLPKIVVTPFPVLTQLGPVQVTKKVPKNPQSTQATQTKNPQAKETNQKPRLLISPSVTPAALRSPISQVSENNGPVVLDLKVIQKNPPKPKPKLQGPLVLPPICIKPDPNYNPNKVADDAKALGKEKARARNPEFYAMLERKRQWKKDHPNWREEMYPNWEAEHEQYIKSRADKRENLRIEKQLEEQMRRERKINRQEQEQLRQEQKQIRQEQKQMMFDISTVEDTEDTEGEEGKEGKEDTEGEDEMYPVPNPVMSDKGKEEEEDSEDDGPIIVSGDVFERAAKQSKRIAEANNRMIEITDEFVSDEANDDWSFGAVTSAAHVDMESIIFEDDDSLMNEVVDSMFQFENTLPIVDSLPIVDVDSMLQFEDTSLPELNQDEDEDAEESEDDEDTIVDSLIE